MTRKITYKEFEDKLIEKFGNNIDLSYINKENFKEITTNGKEIGLDFGIKTNITTSEGEKLDVCVEESDRLKRL